MMPATDEPTRRAMELFHAHLDACGRCRQNPFDLCPVGEGLLRGVSEASKRKLMPEAVQLAMLLVSNVRSGKPQ